MNMRTSIKFNNQGKVYRLEVKQFLPISLKEAWKFFSNPVNLKELTPANLRMNVLSGADAKMYTGQIIQYSVSPLPMFNTVWVTEITYVKEESAFVDEQRYGPYSFWHHKHFFKEVEGGVEVRDVVDYVPPLGLLGRIVNPLIVKPRLLKIFKFREEVLNKMFL
jgi:ligand-binding SRPBCC domain-containing protein